jgi:iron complex transport system substrate-binding protein
MRLQALAWSVAFLAGLGLAVWGHQTLRAATTPRPIPPHPESIVTLAPSVTETVFAVGLGPSVTGVTSYCRYPPEVETLPKVAGFSDVNVEAILRLRPDLVILPVDKTATAAELSRLGLTVMPLDTRNLEGLMHAMTELGAATGRGREAELALDRIRSAIAYAREKARGKPKPRVLFSVMHSYAGVGYISEITAAGNDGFFSNLIEICGGVNAYEGRLPFPTLSREAIFQLNPDVVIDLLQNEADAPDAMKGWLQLGNISAVRRARVYIFTEESDTVPGPRAWKTIRKVSDAIQPDPPLPRGETEDAGEGGSEGPGFTAVSGAPGVVTSNSGALAGTVANSAAPGGTSGKAGALADSAASPAAPDGMAGASDGTASGPSASAPASESL